MASEDGLVRGVILHGAGETRIVPLDGGEVLRGVGATSRGAAGIGFDRKGYVDFLDRIRLDPYATLYAAFDVAHGAAGLVVIGAVEVRPASEDEVVKAIGIETSSALAAAGDRGIGPVMTAAELDGILNDDEAPPAPAR